MEIERRARQGVAGQRLGPSCGFCHRFPLRLWSRGLIRPSGARGLGLNSDQLRPQGSAPTCRQASVASGPGW